MSFSVIPPIRSTKLRKHAKGQPCTLRFEGCDGGGETTVLAHIRDKHKGGGVKASDLSGCYACHSCHNRLDSEFHKLEPAYFYFHQLRALQETLEILVADNIIIVPQDPVTPLLSRPVKPRKAKSERAAINSAPFQKNTTKRAWPKRKFGE